MDDVKLHHPVPTRQTYLPEPPSTPASPQDYMRFSSTPSQQRGQQQYAQQQSPPQPLQPQHQQAYPVPPTAPYGYPQQPGQPGFGFVAPNMWGVNDATAQIGMQLGQSAVHAGSEYVKQNFGGAIIPLSALKHQFQVSNSYVVNKLRLVLFPWRHKPWYRKTIRSEGGQTDGFLAPRDDINSPDLYIPSMALVTYVLLSAVKLGLKTRFNPRVLGATTSSAIFCVFFEVLLVRLSCYLLNIQGSASVVDLVAYAGYKFVGIIATIFTDFLTTRSWVYWSVFVYVFLANALFLVRSLRYVALPESAAGVAQTYTATQRSRRVYFLFIVAAFQLPLMLLLVYM
ncbi:YIF1-domain-containing protein [Exidia glandulosa HHB12029]|uniref:Protein YIF1 n=1 Tax=Exidia glandulosa HHB12029 TaxID=1314781 RepID=A0A165J841_EXIGL|nr:YIF1-domain-containing protein [Exidia glandulosa HHB12029]